MNFKGAKPWSFFRNRSKIVKWSSLRLTGDPWFLICKSWTCLCKLEYFWVAWKRILRIHLKQRRIFTWKVVFLIFHSLIYQYYEQNPILNINIFYYVILLIILIYYEQNHIVENIYVQYGIQLIHDHRTTACSLKGWVSLDFVYISLNSSKKELSEISWSLSFRLRRLSLEVSDNSIFSASSSRISSPLISEVYAFINISSKFSIDSSFSEFELSKFYCLISLIKSEISINLSPLSYFKQVEIIS